MKAKSWSTPSNARKIIVLNWFLAFALASMYMVDIVSPVTWGPFY